MSSQTLLFYVLVTVLAILGLFFLYIGLMGLKDYIKERRARVLTMHGPYQLLQFHGRLFRLHLAAFEAGKSSTLTFRTLEEDLVEDARRGTHSEGSLSDYTEA